MGRGACMLPQRAWAGVGLGRDERALLECMMARAPVVHVHHQHPWVLYGENLVDDTRLLDLQTCAAHGRTAHT
eukprot:7200799-Prymnesium_polylepis.2